MDTTAALEKTGRAPGERWRASYASDPQRSRGRRHREAESETRSPFQRDRDRIIHSAAFRRLMLKTQVFVAHEGDHYRTRLTHSLEVAQIARSISRELGLDEELAEALALAHDLGHPPFGHAGETALAQAMEPYGGFDHNANTLRVLTELEARYAEFDGLNLTWETLEGIVKHNGPVVPSGKDLGSAPWAFTAYAGWADLEPHSHASLEAQVAALADDIAYNNHDIDDGLRAGLFKAGDLYPLPFVGDVFAEVMERYPGVREERLIHESVRRIISRMIADCVSETRRRVEDMGLQTVEDVRAADKPVAAFTAERLEAEKSLRSFLWENMYRHYKVNRMMSRAKRVIRDLFAAFLEDPSLLPTEWRRRAGPPGEEATARLVCDYVAGMTDRFAMEEHHRLFALDQAM